MNKMGRPFSDPVRNAEIARLFRSGKLMPEIAESFFMTASGIATVLRKAGVHRTEGGKSEIARQRNARIAYEKEIDKAVLKIEAMQCPVSLFDSFEQMATANQRFREQRMRANNRKVEWKLSFLDWWQIWLDSGRWNERGRSHANSAVMARYGDVGPYAVGNVHVITLSENFIESWETAPNRNHGGRLKVSSSAEMA